MNKQIKKSHGFLIYFILVHETRLYSFLNLLDFYRTKNGSCVANAANLLHKWQLKLVTIRFLQIEHLHGWQACKAKGWKQHQPVLSL
jgi:hypothetical protein